MDRPGSVPVGCRELLRLLPCEQGNSVMAHGSQPLSGAPVWSPLGRALHRWPSCSTAGRASSPMKCGIKCRHCQPTPTTQHNRLACCCNLLSVMPGTASLDPSPVSLLYVPVYLPTPLFLTLPQSASAFLPPNPPVLPQPGNVLINGAGSSRPVAKIAVGGVPHNLCLVAPSGCFCHIVSTRTSRVRSAPFRQSSFIQIGGRAA